MHILLIHQAFAALDEPGGTRHHEIARYLAEQGHRVTVIASSVSYLTGASDDTQIPWVERQQDGKNISVLRSYTYPALHKSFVHRIISFFSFMLSSFIVGLGVRDIDLVWGTSPPIFQGLTAWLLARLKRVPFMFEVRDLWPAFAIAVGVLKNKPLIRASQWMEKFLYRHADQLLVNSPGFIEHVQARGGSSIKLVPNGADVRMFDPDADGAAFRCKHGLEGKFIALYAGAHGMSNDLDIILDAADRLRAEPNIAIVLLGDGKEKPALMKKAAKMDLPNLHFLAPLPKTEMAAPLAAANACIAILKPIELYKTVYPNKVFDYMAAGRAVILAIDGVIRDVVDSANCGITVPPGDADSLTAAIRSLNENPQRGRALGRNGRRYVEEHFDRRALSKKILALMDQISETC
ncbi:MAG: glycosyltransferase family 4 protein [Chloroflexota bacterium]|nr:glycosyltransferase family 4 protein [Chloroflexota bacterium]